MHFLFFHVGFAARKLAFLTDVFRLIQKWSLPFKSIPSATQLTSTSTSSPTLPPEPRSPPTKMAYFSDPEEPAPLSSPSWTQALTYIQSSIATLESTLQVVGSRLSHLEKEQDLWLQKYHTVLSEKETYQHECELLRKQLRRYSSTSNPPPTSSSSTTTTTTTTTISPPSSSSSSTLPSPPSVNLPSSSLLPTSFSPPLPLPTSSPLELPSVKSIDFDPTLLQQAHQFRSRIQERLMKTQGLLSKTTKYMDSPTLESSCTPSFSTTSPPRFRSMA
ncbi:hypothetical protein HMI56_002485 [Coelomomyces lativittatus]|nr:hypothetical protein HMI56_002485 [Coelomomyces lativittatus]